MTDSDQRTKRKYDKHAPRCTAKSKSSGVQCEQPALAGATVCRYHGGAAEQVRRKARERLLSMVDPALGTLSALLREKKQKGVALGAARDVLDRNDLTGKTRIDLEHGGSIVHRVELVVIDGIDDSED